MRPEGTCVFKHSDETWCGRPAEVQVTGRWTIFDCLTYETCDEHANDAVTALRRRTVDGQLVQAIEVQYVM